MVFTLFSLSAFSQQTGRLYISSLTDSQIFDITDGVTPVQVANFTTGANNATNLAVGYDPTVNPSTLVFIHSNTGAGSVIYKNGTSTFIASPTQIGGLGTNNVPGSQFGHVYGFFIGTPTTTKNISRVYPTATTSADPITISAAPGDTIWAGSTIFTSDAFFDYDNNLYAVVTNAGTRYLYKIKINPVGNSGTAVATQVFQVTGTLPGSVLGTAYLNGKMYLVDNSTTPVIYSINMGTGVAQQEKILTTSFGSSRDLASVDYFVPFKFDCARTAVVGNGFFRVELLRQER